jgi:hypothetical protein
MRGQGGRGEERLTFSSVCNLSVGGVLFLFCNRFLVLNRTLVLTTLLSRAIASEPAGYIPCQEEGNISYVLENGVGAYSEDPAQMVGLYSG